MRQLLTTLFLGLLLSNFVFAEPIASTDFMDGGDGTIAGDTSGAGWAAAGWTVENAGLGGAIVPTTMSYDVPGGGIVSATSAVQFTGSPLAMGVQRDLASPQKWGRYLYQLSDEVGIGRDRWE